jgi:predicted nucleic acid-binding protein
MTAELVFVDTNVLLYAHDRSAGVKREVASVLLEHLG